MKKSEICQKSEKSHACNIRIEKDMAQDRIREIFHGLDDHVWNWKCSSWKNSSEESGDKNSFYRELFCIRLTVVKVRSVM